MLRQDIGFSAVLIKHESKFKSERDDVVTEFALRYVDKHDNQSFLDTYEKRCNIENISSLFREPVAWKNISIDCNYKFEIEFDELDAFECILKEIKIKRKYSAKDMSDAFTYDLVFERESENDDKVFASYLKRKEEDEGGKKSLMQFLCHLEPIESVDDYVETEDED
jgi:hypothetical protein